MSEPVAVVTELPVEDTPKTPRFTRKQIVLAAASAVGVIGLAYLWGKRPETDEETNDEETVTVEI
jgi:hypothetical protein